MDDYIKRSSAINMVEQFFSENETPGGWQGARSLLTYAILAIPAAEVVERKRGTWKKEKYGGVDCLTCSVCGMTRNYLNRFNYCPNCGAKMIGEGNG